MQPRRRLKIVMMSDTHGKEDIKWEMEGDIFIHAGDFTMYSNQRTLFKFCEQLDKLKFKHKIVVCGNHEINLDKNMDEGGRLYFNNMNKQNPLFKTAEEAKQKLRKHCTYLEHEYVEIEGIRIFGSPHTVHYHDTAFHYEKEQEQYVWPGIPDVDILITHGPPHGILDTNDKGFNCGSKLLLERVKKMQPRIHVFGHIHESGGVLKQDKTLFINAGQVDRNYDVSRKPYVAYYEL